MSGYKVKRLAKPRPSTAHSYFSFGSSSVTPVPLPPLPKWMLDTPMHGKLPMIPAPKGKIALHTTGLCEKLHHTLSELDFDPNPQGLSTEYSSLHDKHLKSHFSHPSMISRLARNGFITSGGKVNCTLKEFNDYQQHLKRVRLEKETQDRKRRTRDERNERDRMRWCRPKTSKQLGCEKRAKDTKERKDKLMKEQRSKLTHKHQERETKRIQHLEERHRIQKTEEAVKVQEQERVRLHKLQLSKEEKRTKAYYLRKRGEEEKTRAIKLELRRQMAKEARENKLEQNWERKLLFQELLEVEDKLKKLHAKEEMEAQIDAREMAAESQRLRQQGVFDRIRAARAKKSTEKEQKIFRYLEAKHKKAQAKFDRKRKRIAANHKRSGTPIAAVAQRRHTHARYHHTMRTSTWEITECLLADICSDKTKRDQTKPFMNPTTPQRSTQELPTVSPPGVCRKVSWHESMSDLSSKGRLPPIGSRLFSEEDEEMYSPSSPEISTSEESAESQISGSNNPTLSSAENDSCECTLKAAIQEETHVHVQLEEADQRSSLVFTQEDFEHFLEIGSNDSLDSYQPTTSTNTRDQENADRCDSVLDQPTHPADHQSEDDKQRKHVEFVKSVVGTAIIHVISSLFQCAGSSDTISMASCQSRSDTIATPTQIMIDEAEISSYIQRSESGRLTPYIGGREDGATDGAESVLTGIIDDDSLNSFGISIVDQPLTTEDIDRVACTPRACSVVRNAISSALSSLDTSDASPILDDSVPASSLEGHVPTINVEGSTQCEQEESATSEHEKANISIEQPTPIPSTEILIPAHEVEGGLIDEEAASPEYIYEEESDSSLNSENNVGYSLARSSTLLQSVIDVFGGSSVSMMGEFRSSSGEDFEEEEEDDDDEEEGEVIGFLENPNIAHETGTSVAESLSSQEGALTETVSISDENRATVEGAIRRASSGDFFGHKGSITGEVLSIENLTKVNSSKRLVQERVGGIFANDGDNDDLKKLPFEPEDRFHHIIPLYHNHAVDVGEDLIDSNLSAISMKPDPHKTLPQAHETSGRNSFRNIFRPDLTYCEGSAKCLKSTLVHQLSHSSGRSSHARMMHVLDQEHHDVTAHHSNEEVVYTDDAEGVCQWPKSRAFQVHHVVDEVVTEQDELAEAVESDDANDQNKRSEIQKREQSERSNGKNDLDTKKEEQEQKKGTDDDKSDDEIKVSQKSDQTYQVDESLDGEGSKDNKGGDLTDNKKRIPLVEEAEVTVDMTRDPATDTNYELKISSHSSVASNDLLGIDGSDTHHVPLTVSYGNITIKEIQEESTAINESQLVSDENVTNVSITDKQMLTTSDENQAVVTTCNDDRTGTSAVEVMRQANSNNDIHNRDTITIPHQPNSTELCKKESTIMSDDKEQSNKNSNRSKISSMSIDCRQSTDVLIKVSEKKSSFVFKSSQHERSGIDDELTVEHELGCHRIDQLPEADETDYFKDKTVSSNTDHKRKSKHKVRVKVKQAESDTGSKPIRKSSTPGKGLNIVKRGASSNVKLLPAQKGSHGLSGADATAGSRSSIASSSAAAPHLSSKTITGEEVVRRKGHKKSHSKRILSASKSMVNGNRRPTTAKLRYLSQSRSANAPAQAKHVSSTSRDTESEEPVVSHGGPTATIARMSSVNVKNTHSNSLMDRKTGKSDTVHHKEHSVILVQPVKEKRSSCTVIMPANKRSSLLSTQSSTKDL